MNLETAIRIYAASAGTQVTDSGQGDAWIKDYLKKKQDKLDKTRRSVAPYPEDKKGIYGGGPGSGRHPEGVTIKRSASFKHDGLYDVHVDGKGPHKIYRDPESGYWFRDAPSVVKNGVSTGFEHFLGFKKDEALEKIAKQHREGSISAVTKEVGHWSPAPEDVKSINKKSYKSGMKKAKTVPRASLHTAPGAVPLQDITGSDQVGNLKCVIRKKGNKHCVMSEDGTKNLGCGNSHGWAVKRLQQVEYFKHKK